MQRNDEDITSDDELTTQKLLSLSAKEETWSEKRQRTLKRIAHYLNTTLPILERLLDRNADHPVMSRTALYDYFKLDMGPERPDDLPFCEVILNCTIHEIVAQIIKFDCLDSSKFASQRKIAPSTITKYCHLVVKKKFSRIVLENQTINEFLQQLIKHIHGEEQTSKWVDFFDSFNLRVHIENFLFEYLEPIDTIKLKSSTQLLELASRYSKKFSELTLQEKINLKKEIQSIQNSVTVCHVPARKILHAPVKQIPIVDRHLDVLPSIKDTVEPLSIHAADISKFVNLINEKLPKSRQFNFKQIQQLLSVCKSRLDLYQSLHVEDYIARTTIDCYLDKLSANFFELAVNKTAVDILEDLKKAVVPDLKVTLLSLGQPFTRFESGVVTWYIKNHLHTSFYLIFFESRNISIFLNNIRNGLKMFKYKEDLVTYLDKSDLATNPDCIKFFDKYFGCSHEDFYAQLTKMNDEDFEKICKLYSDYRFENLSSDQIKVFRAEFTPASNKRSHKDLLEVTISHSPLKKYAVSSPLMFTVEKPIEPVVPVESEVTKIIFKPNGGDWLD